MAKRTAVLRETTIPCQPLYEVEAHPLFWGHSTWNQCRVCFCSGKRVQVFFRPGSPTKVPGLGLRERVAYDLEGLLVWGTGVQGEARAEPPHTYSVLSSTHAKVGVPKNQPPFMGVLT